MTNKPKDIYPHPDYYSLAAAFVTITDSHWSCNICRTFGSSGGGGEGPAFVEFLKHYESDHKGRA